jgi:protein-tyrosine phosphatase
MHHKATASPVTDKLWVGGHPPVGPGLSEYGIDALVLAADGFQPPAKLFPDIKVLHAPMHDDYERMHEGDADRAVNAGLQVAKWLKEGKKVLSTCWQGRNRSGVIAALALMLTQKSSPEEAINLIRASRGASAMGNPHFNLLLQAVQASRTGPRTRPSGRTRT